MYSSFQLAKKYLHYYLTAFNGSGHGMHSPFVFRFILNVLNNAQHLQPPSSIETLRTELLNRNEKLVIEDFGAGSRIRSTKERTVAQIAKAALKPKKYSGLLFRLAAFYKPASVIELGTSLGTTTAYLASAVPAATILTIEGSEAIREVALSNFKKLGLTNIQSHHGNFDALLPTVVDALSSVDLAYIDGNHRYEPTLKYFNQFLSKTHNDSILVFDDIHWSGEMESAWKEIQQHPAVRCTVDIFFLGFVFFRQEFKEKQHFLIRF